MVEELKNMQYYIDKCQCYIHSLKKGEVGGLAEAVILEKIGDNLYLAEYNGVKCTAIYNPFVGKYYVDDVYGVRR
jgi:hypothetical protein